MRDRPHFKVHVRFEAKPVPVTAFDWEAWVDGEEETTSVTAPSCYDALRELANRLEDLDERQREREQREIARAHAEAEALAGLA